VDSCSSSGKHLQSRQFDLEYVLDSLVSLLNGMVSESRLKVAQHRFAPGVQLPLCKPELASYGRQKVNLSLNLSGLVLIIISFSEL